MLSKGLCVQIHPLFFPLMVSRGFTCAVTTTGLVLIHFSGQHRQHWGLAAAAGSQPQASDFGGHRITFFGHLGLAWRSPIGCPLPWKRGWHGSAEPALARVGSSCRFPNRPRIVGVEQAGGREGERCGQLGSAGPRSHPAGSKGVETRWRIPEHRLMCPQVLTYSQPSGGTWPCFRGMIVPETILHKPQAERRDVPLPGEDPCAAWSSLAG